MDQPFLQTEFAEQGLASHCGFSGDGGEQLSVITEIQIQQYNAKRFFCKIIQMWNNVISVRFFDEKCTNSWRQTFTKDFEGIYKRVGGMPFKYHRLKPEMFMIFFVLINQESPLNQIEFYCSKIEDLENSVPLVSAIIETCALEAVPSLCQASPE